MDVYLHVKFEVFSIIVTSFRQGEGELPPPSLQNEPLKSPLRLGLNKKLSLNYCFQLEDLQDSETPGPESY